MEDGAAGNAASTAAAGQPQPAGGGLGRLGRPNFQGLREGAQQQAEAAKRLADQKAAQAKAEADRLSAENPEFAAVRAATEQKAAAARAEAERLALENKQVLEQNAEAARRAAEEMREISQLPPEERNRAMAMKALETKAAGEQLYAQNREMLEKNKAAADAVRRDAERAAQEARAKAAVLGQQAIVQGAAVAATAVNIARDEFESRCAAVLEKEEKLRLAAMEVEKREKQLSLLLQKAPPNWPRKFCCIEPMVHHDILSDIPPERQSYVRKGYINYYFTCFLLVANFALSLTMLVLKNKKDETGATKKTDDDGAIQHLGISVLFLTGIIFSFILWYWPVYKACGTGSSGQYIMGFVGLSVALFFDVFAAIGPVGYGGTGIVWAMQVNKDKGDKAFIPAIIMAVLWILQGVVFAWMIWRLYRYYQEDKASLAKAKAELFSNELRSVVGA